MTGVFSPATAGGAEQALAPEDEVNPVGHGAHEALRVKLKVLGAQAAHAVAPKFPEKVPGEHSLHSAAPAVLDFVPRGQLLQAVVPGLELNFPASQATHPLCVPFGMLPGGQKEQDVDPAIAKVPGGQPRHSTDPERGA
jgi:hypothetical protein